MGCASTYEARSTRARSGSTASAWRRSRDFTPRLQKIRETDDKLLVFDHVFSTQTHTRPSLLEALSFGVREGEAYLPINRRQRLSLVDVLASNQVRTTLDDTVKQGNIDWAYSTFARYLQRLDQRRGEIGVGRAEGKIEIKAVGHPHRLAHAGQAAKPCRGVSAPAPSWRP